MHADNDETGGGGRQDKKGAPPTLHLLAGWSLALRESHTLKVAEMAVAASSAQPPHVTLAPIPSFICYHSRALGTLAYIRC